MTELGGDNGLYYDDLRIGQRFTSKTHVVDEEQIKAFARQFDPQPFHLDSEAAHFVFGLGGKRLAHGCDHHAPSG
jgi:acyl dehydratase